MMSIRNSSKATLLVASLMALGACSTLGGAGPSTGAVRSAGEASYKDAGIKVVDLSADVVSQMQALESAASFAQVFGEAPVSVTEIGAGDTLDIAIWEAPPAVLFGVRAADPSFRSDPGLAASASIPQQQVGEDGRITVPFVGRIAVAGLRPEQVEQIITSRLAGRANNPQAVVRLVSNESRTVTMLGNVARSGRVPLTARGERLLDALASAGGPREAIEQVTLQLTRGQRRAVMPLERVINEPAQNVPLQPGDVVTAQHQPFSFVALGAVARNAEIPFEGAGINLAEALGRVGGLNDRRADVKGVFVFRMVPVEALTPPLPPSDPSVSPEGVRATLDGRVPVVYRLQMSDPASLFAMQEFTMRDGDVLYVSTAPGVELERFLTTISSTAFSIVATGNALRD